MLACNKPSDVSKRMVKSGKLNAQTVGVTVLQCSRCRHETKDQKPITRRCAPFIRRAWRWCYDVKELVET